MVKKSFNIDVDIKESLTNRPFEVVQGDTGNIINISVLDDGQPVDLTGCRVLAVFSKSSGTSSQDSGVSDGGITISGNTVQLQLFTSSFDLGMIECELQIYSDAEMSTLITTAKFNFKARRGILNNDTVQSTNEYPILLQLIQEVRDLAAGIPWLPAEPADLPLFTSPGGVLTTKPVADAKIALDIDPRGFEYAGREIPFTWAQIQAKIRSGDFTGLRDGDYKDIVLNGSFYDAAADVFKTIASETFRMEIAGIDSYYQYGDVAAPHHIDFISRDCYGQAIQYNATDTNAGSFIGSALFTSLNGENGIIKLLPTDVAAVIIAKRGLTETKTGASASGWSWNDMGKLWLPTEREVWGNRVWSEAIWIGGLNIQYPIFKHGLRHIVKGAGHQGNRCHWWCASSAADSAVSFCYVGFPGVAYSTTATSIYIHAPLCFRVA